MRVLMYYSNKDVRLEEMPVPEIGPDELLMKIVASGICGSDVMEWYRRDKVSGAQHGTSGNNSGRLILI